MSEEQSHNPFIPSELDEAGLPANQFRVLCHLWRRGETFSNAATIAKVCRLKRDTVFDVLAELEKAGFIHRKSRPGQTTLIEPVPFGGMGRNNNPSRFGGQDPSRSRGQDPSRFGGRKGDPTKATPLRKSQGAKKPVCFPPLPFQSEAFIQAWEDWQTHRKEKKNPLTPLAVKMQFKELLAWGEHRAVAAIEYSIKKGYSGIFESTSHASKPAAQVKLGGRSHQRKEYPEEQKDLP